VTECIGYQSVQASALNIVQRDLLTENKWISTIDEIKSTQTITSKHIYQLHPSTAGKVSIQQAIMITLMESTLIYMNEAWIWSEHHILSPKYNLQLEN
jgi:hypothetical protein